MKALVISPTLPPARSGGADLAFNLCERLGERGVEVLVLTSVADQIVPSTKFRVEAIMHEWSWNELPRLLRVVRQFRPDVVEVHFAGSIYQHHPMISFLPRFLKRFGGNPRLVVRVEYPDPIVSRPRTIPSRVMDRLTEAYRKWNGLDAGYGALLRESDAVITLCDPHAELLSRSEPSLAGKCITIPPAPSVKICADQNGSVREQTRRRLKLGPSETLLAYYGYVYPNKGLETLFDAFALVTQRTSDVRLIIIGGANEVVLKALERPGYLQELKERAESLGVAERIIWTGYFPIESEEPSALLRATDICVLPFEDGILMHRSSFGVAAVHGLPVVTTRGRNLEEAFNDRVNVVLCPPNHVSALAEAIIELKDDPALRARLANGVKKLAQNYFSWERCLDLTLAVFKGIPIELAPIAKVV